MKVCQHLSSTKSCCAIPKSDPPQGIRNLELCDKVLTWVAYSCTDGRLNTVTQLIVFGDVSVIFLWDTQELLLPGSRRDSTPSEQSHLRLIRKKGVLYKTLPFSHSFMLCVISFSLMLSLCLGLRSCEMKEKTGADHNSPHHSLQMKILICIQW